MPQRSQNTGQNPKLCVFSTLKEYLRRTKHLRQKDSYLFISYEKPHLSVSTQTIARWIKSIMFKAGIDTSTFKAHSTRHASTSAAKAAGVDIETIKNTADWSPKSQVFAKHYDRTIIKEKNTFATDLLNKRKNQDTCLKH